MSTNEPQYSPLDFFLSRHGYTFEQTFFRGFSDLLFSDLLEDKRPPLVKMITESLDFVAWNITSYLHMSRVPREKLEALDRMVPHTRDGMPTRRGWVHLCLALTPPFRTQEPHHVFDMRAAYDHPQGRPCKDYAGLLTDLSTALLYYEDKVRIRDLEDRIEYHWRERTLPYLKIVRNNFQLQRMSGRLPAALQRIRTDEVQKAFDLVALVVQHVDWREEASDPETHRASLSAWYNALLWRMQEAFEAHGPEKLYTKESRRRAISAILFPLLKYSLRPKPNCTTYAAIQKRLNGLKSV